MRRSVEELKKSFLQRAFKTGRETEVRLKILEHHNNVYNEDNKKKKIALDWFLSIHKDEPSRALRAHNLNAHRSGYPMLFTHKNGDDENQRRAFPFYPN